MKSILARAVKRSQVPTLMKRYENYRNEQSIQKSSPFPAIVEDVECLYNTNDEYSYKWFHPRYSGGKLHEEIATNLFVAKAKHAKVIVDIGANLGWFTCLAGTANPDASVYAFEMDDKNHQLCNSNILLNRLSNVVLERKAVSNMNGEITYELPGGKNKAAANFRIDTSGSSKSNRVPCIALDDYFKDKQHPELIKIDVEGAEQLVLEGMHSLLAGGRLKAMLIEIHPVWLQEMGGSVEDIVALLHKHNFLISALNHRANMAVSPQPVDIRDIHMAGRGGRMFLVEKQS